MYKIYDVQKNWLEKYIKNEYKEYMSSKEIKNLYEKLNCETLMIVDTKTKKTIYIWKELDWKISIYTI